MGTVSRIYCPICEFDRSDAGPCATCGGTLEVDVDLRAITPELIGEIRDRRGGMWRWKELLPHPDDASVVSLGEGDTPLVHSARLAEACGIERLWIKNEALLPTGSLKDRSSTISVSRARLQNVTTVATASTGNNAASLAAYAAAAGLDAVVMVPASTAPAKIAQAAAHGAIVIAVDASFGEVHRLFGEAVRELGWYSCLPSDPWRNEGKKTLGFEVWETLGRAPDWMIHPISSGLGLTAAAKAFRELRAIGVVDRGPRMVGAQAASCAPIARAWETGLDDFAPIVARPTIAESIAMATPRLMARRTLRTIRATQGACIASEDHEILAAQSLLARQAGLFCEPAASASVAAAIALRRSGQIETDAVVVCVVTAHGLKQIELAESAVRIDPVAPRLADIASAFARAKAS